ncbi:MAG: HDOD domain-containing protein [Gammaproteobacteria bacterium]|nr:HDOD domain-containing protein [Gammaproteobacteria bacterium]
MDDNENAAPTTCIVCGINDGGEAANSQDVHWLRRDDSLRLGVCSGCADWVNAWDKGTRQMADSSSPSVLDQLIQNATLPSLSHVLLEIYDLLSSETAGADQIAQLIGTDTGLSARTLRLANSAYYGLSRKITTIPEALSRIGPFDLWWLLLTTEVKSLFYGIDRSLADMSGFWRHSLMVASASRVLAERYGVGNPAELFVAGLLHDAGKLLLLRYLPVDYGAVLQQQATGKIPLHQVERESLGFDHAEAGGRLLDRWQLPTALIEPVAGHHRDYLALTPTSLVAVANELAHWMESADMAITLPEIADEQTAAATERLFRRLADLVL